MEIKYLPESLKKIIRKTSYWKNYHIKSGEFVRIKDSDKILDEANALINDDIRTSKIKPVVGIVKDLEIDVEGYCVQRASWLRYERFCKNNNLDYRFINILRHDWIRQFDGVDILIWHTDSSPLIQEIAETKIYILEKEMGITCFPSFHEIWQYENKIRSNYLYSVHNLPSIPTFVTNDYSDAVECINKLEFPIVSKISTGSGSHGVELINSKIKAIRIIKKIFKNGRDTYWKYYKQKDYCYFQSFIRDAMYDLRIILVGNKAFGYYRYPKENDFRASGSGIIEKKEIPKDAIKLAVEIRKILKCTQIGVDLLYSIKKKKYYIIETSVFNQIDTPRQLEINGVAGFYDISDLNNITFLPGKFWVQELQMENIIISWISKKS